MTLGQGVEARKGLCTDIRAQTGYKGFTFGTSPVGEREVNFFAPTILHSLADPKLGEDRKASTGLPRVQMRPTLGITGGERM